MIFHHVIVDGWSIAVLIRELNQILQAFIDKKDPSEGLAPVHCQFHQYVANLNPKMWDADIAYWKEKLSNGAMNFACLPSDHQTDSDISGATFVRDIPPVLVHLLQSSCQSIDATPFMILLAMFDVLLARCTTCWGDIVVAAPVFNRPYSEIENTVGLFVNVLLMRVDLSADPTFYELMINVKRTVLEAFEHQESPLTHVTSQLEHLERDSHIPQLFQVLFAYQNVGEIVSTNLLHKIPVTNPIAKCDLEVHVWENKQGALSIHAQYRKKVFKASTIERLIDQWMLLLDAAS
ncbi:unnamed protein product [Didymodactylos carnosus]|uniref:Condensation domain-containing protein n=2 Tax=Didymodactylos carnosus TaxID=1234261 RepID=A0A8S2DZD1_9BILA|nr:unnamed protein product [Didymodactylos carnosus]CAF3853583.1 unnamed protein product [Didymodactylos carnosus]